MRLSGVGREEVAEYRQYLKKIFVGTGLPLDNVSRIHIVKRGDFYEKLMDGDAEYNPRTKTITLRDWLFTDTYNLVSLATHELAHANSPFNKNDRLFGSRTRTEVSEYVKRVGDYLLAANLPLDDYHMKVMKRYKLPPFSADRVTKQYYYEETWAILVQLRLTNPDQLRDLEDIVTHRRETNPSIPYLMSPRKSARPLGIDIAISALRSRA
jgi:hypothetical protein